MKKVLLILAGGILLTAGCKEVGPIINFSNSLSVDSSYILTTIPATAPHNVLVENFSGQSCPNCPAAEANLASEEAQYPTPAPGRVNSIVMFAPGPPQASPPLSAKYDLEDSAALQIENSVYNGVGQLPTVGIDRAAVSENLQIISPGIWDGAISTQTSVADSLNLSVQSTYNTYSSMATTIVTVTYTQAINYTQNINIALVEDSITDIHEEPAGIAPYTSGYDTTYLYMDVFRGYVSSGITGDVIYPKSPASKPQGLVYRRTYTYSLPAVLTNTIASNPPIKYYHCRVIAFVTNNGTNGTVAQSAQTSLTGL